MKIDKQKERREIILNILLGVGLLTTAVVAPNAVQLFKYFLPKNNRERWEIKKSLMRLEKSGLVKKKTTNGDEYYSLTLLGNIRAKRYKLDSMKIEPQKKWDGMWRLVMFDVPEKKMMARRGINLVLKKLGCVQYQKSVFITPFPCEKEIDFVGECFDVREHIRVITARDVEGVEAIRKVYKL
jgi:DNA-binding transcriptional regulator PaaX